MYGCASTTGLVISVDLPRVLIDEAIDFNLLLAWTSRHLLQGGLTFKDYAPLPLASLERYQPPVDVVRVVCLS